MPEGGFRDLELRVAYGPGDDALHTFYLPTLSRAVHYDRSAGYFSSGALVVAGQGLARLIANGGTMRLLVGAQLSHADVEAIRSGTSIQDVTRERLIGLLAEPEDELARKRLEALAWMVAAGTLELKVVLPRGPDGLPLAADDAEGYYHPKKGLFTDAAGDRVGFSGSINESINAWRRHFEEFHVYRSWEPGERPHLSQVEAFFSRVWDNEDPDWISLPVPEAVREGLLRYCPDEPPEHDPLERPSVVAAPAGSSDEQATIAWFLRDVPYLLDVGERVGRATAAIEPWPHQLRVASAVVERYPERFLLADEVGLGKTIEAGLILRDLLVSAAVERCLILAPASVLRQWQDELREKFALEVPIYEAGQLVGPGPDRVARPLAGRNPWEEVPVVLASSQLVKRKDRRAELLSGPDWDLVVVDEAHHARRKDFLDLSLRRPNRLLELLEGTDGLPGLASKTRGLLLLTATPMQVHPVEVWDLLAQLGLAGRWGASEQNFLRYFNELRLAAAAPAEADWRFLAAMARDELEFGGPIDDEVARLLEGRLGFAGWTRVRDFPYASDPLREARAMSDDDRAALLALLRHLTPLRRRMFRHTRSLLRRYQERGLLPGRIAERDPEPRWIAFEPDEATLYARVDEYISNFYRKYEGERKGLGFVMTVYRRRLTSSFYALERSLERRLAFLRGQAPELGLTDEDLEDADLSEDITEELVEARSRELDAIQTEEIGYVEDFLRELRGLGTDSKFDQLRKDLDEALAKRDSVVIFTQYADTVDYLKEKLREVYGHRVACYTGRGGERWESVAWAPATKEEIKRAFRDGDVRILIGTDALAEGLNLQTCGVEINYDAPWNPMRLEQRIGRLDRIGQRHDVVWIWTYFYEDTVEAQVYQRLLNRIDWFKGVVGPLQPILNRVERTIRDLALEEPEQRKDRLQDALRSLEEDIDRVRQEGFDLDAVLEERLEPVPAPSPPVTQGELAAFFASTPVLASKLRPHGEIAGAFAATVSGEELVVTFDPDVSDEHPDTVRLLTFGDRVLEELLSSAGMPREPRGKLVRVGLTDSPRRWVAWYRSDGTGAARVDALADLQAAIAGAVPPHDGWIADAEEDFVRSVSRRLEAERDEAIRRADERLSALRERARNLLARATYVWTARKTGGAPHAGEITETTMRSMIATEGFPFGPLSTKIPQVPELGKGTPGWAEVEPKNEKQLEGMWQSVKVEADRLVRRIVEAERERELASTAPPPPAVQVTIV